MKRMRVRLQFSALHNHKLPAAQVCCDVMNLVIALKHDAFIFYYPYLRTFFSFSFLFFCGEQERERETERNISVREIH